MTPRVYVCVCVCVCVCFVFLSVVRCACLCVCVSACLCVQDYRLIGIPDTAKQHRRASRRCLSRQQRKDKVRFRKMQARFEARADSSLNTVCRFEGGKGDGAHRQTNPDRETDGDRRKSAPLGCLVLRKLRTEVHVRVLYVLRAANRRRVGNVRGRS